jgi:hypothetical protein
MASRRFPPRGMARRATGLLSLVLAGALTATADPIDRHALVERHNPSNPWAPLTVGNGRFAFTVDSTGLQTFLAYARRAYRRWSVAKAR